MKLEADLVVLNANVVTMDPAQPEATALAVKNYKFLAVGTDEDMEELVPTARRVIDLGGKTVIPGIVDAHTHITAAGLRSADIDLSSAKSLGDAKRMISASLMRYRMGQWVRAYGWDESKWPEKRYLTASDLDDISREMPIVADRVDGHLTSVNTAALERLKISPEQEGFLKDSEGRPTGVLRDIEGVHDAIIHTPEEMEEGIRRATRLANSHGMTTVVDNISPGVLRYIRECEARNELTARFVVNVPDSQLVHLTSLGVTSGMGTPLVKIGGVKIFADGSIGARTAALSEPYRDEPGNLGRLMMSGKKLAQLVKKAVHGGIQTAIHAIGDAAIELVIKTFEEMTDKEKELVRRQRHRIEHAEMISEDQIRRAAALRLILSMQPNFVGNWQQPGGLYEERLGEERVRGMNMFKVALENGARICFGSDGMPYGPLYGIWSAVTCDNYRVRIGVEQALRCYTMEAAFASHVEDIVGSITVGKRADFVVLSQNIMKAQPEDVRDIVVENTFVGGNEEFAAIKNR